VTAGFNESLQSLFAGCKSLRGEFSLFLLPSLTTFYRMSANPALPFLERRGTFSVVQAAEGADREFAIYHQAFPGLKQVTRKGHSSQGLRGSGAGLFGHTLLSVNRAVKHEGCVRRLFSVSIEISPIITGNPDHRDPLQGDNP
jgi:hypothetical protein